MKKTILLLFTLLLLFSTTSTYGQSSNGSKRVVVELFTGTWGAYCPGGEWYCDTLEKHYQDSTIILAWHGPIEYAEPLAHPGGDTLFKLFALSGYPVAILDRSYQGGFTSIVSQTSWTASIHLKPSLAKAPLLDVSISNIKNFTYGPSTVEFDVSITPVDNAKLPNEDTASYALVVALTEDDIIEAQMIDGTNGFPFGEIESFIHNNVVRTVAGSSNGDSLTLNLSEPGTIYPITKHYSLTIDPAWRRDKLRIKTFVMVKYPLNKKSQHTPILNGIESSYLSSHLFVRNTQKRVNDKSLINYPNPFTSTTNINFEVPDRSFVTLTVHNELGVEVARLVNENLEAGQYSVDFSAQNISNGLYTYILESGSTKLVGKMSVVK
jgi:hypothetical protein